jgi:hypothetical protein
MGLERSKLSAWRRYSVQGFGRSVYWALAAVFVFLPHTPATAADAIRVRTLSSLPEAVSGGDTLVQLEVPVGSHWKAKLNGVDITSRFHAEADARIFRAVLTGLRVGNNTVDVQAAGAGQSRLDIVNHPLSGPIFSGPHQKPMVCQTSENGLGPALDEDCSAATVVQYYYKLREPPQTDALQSIRAAIEPSFGKTAPGFQIYDIARPPPDASVARVELPDGTTVPYIVRREVGTINRAVYDIQFLHRPGQRLPTPFTGPTPGWNGKLVYSFGGGCSAGFRQGILHPAGKEQETPLTLRYAVATSTLNAFSNDCNDRISAETLSMVKEHFIETYGPPAHTIGWGSSGGAVQQYLIAQNYPGLLDGIVAGQAVPDIASGVVHRFTDCPLLDRAISASTRRWTEAQKTAVSGYATWRICAKYLRTSFVAPGNCDQSIPRNLIYDRVGNPKGARCDYYDNEVNVFGRDPMTGFARRALDNVGVQYGLLAFNDGRIDAEQFIQLNEHMGGYDADGALVDARMHADTEAVRVAYQAGLVMTGGGGLGNIPIIDWRWYTEDLGDGHDRLDSFLTRARLLAANGNADNHVVLVDPRMDQLTLLTSSDAQISFIPQRERELISQMDRWLDHMAADNVAGALPERIARNKPAELADGCWATDGERIFERASYDGKGKCNQMYPPHGNTRMAAGAPLADDILKCQLKPVSRADYHRPLTQQQLERLAAIFPDGVCDYRQPGIGQMVTRTTWQRYDGTENVARADLRAK